MPYRHGLDNYHSPFYNYNEGRVNTISSENQLLNSQITKTLDENQICSSKVQNQHYDINTLSNVVEDKQRAWVSLNNDLDKQIEEANKYLSSQKQAFISLESFKVNSHVDIVNNQTNEIKKEQTMEDRNKSLFNKINDLENDMQEQIKNWKNKYADVKEQNEIIIAGINKN